jgi:hypothetical protein
MAKRLPIMITLSTPVSAIPSWSICCDRPQVARGDDGTLGGVVEDEAGQLQRFSFDKNISLDW